MHNNQKVDNGPMLNAYPDSMDKTFAGTVRLLQRPEFQEVFQSFYILPSIFHTDLDRGFSVIDYELDKLLAERADLETLKKLGLNLKLDFILNHASVLSEPFQDILKNGENSEYKDFFINWNKFWEGKGEMTAEGYIQPRSEYIKNMFFRKPGLPILMVRMPNGRDIPYWNTFYQEIRYSRLEVQDLMQRLGLQYGQANQLSKYLNMQLDEGKMPAELDFFGYEEQKEAVVEFLESSRRYLGQMDLNIKSPLVWKYYDDTLHKLAGYGAKIVRLDAFAYAPKKAGEKNFLNEPGTWELLDKVKKLADQYELTLLPEIHASYSEKIYEVLANKGFLTYDFFLPGLILYAMEKKSGEVLARWARELTKKKIRVVNMLGCHDGIPLLDLKGFLPEREIRELIDTLVARGGYVKNLHGKKNMYYQVNATYYSALGADDKKMLLARALQIFMPGKPQVWYLDLFAGKNDYEAVKQAGAGGHKEINRTNLTEEQLMEQLSKNVVKKQLELLRFRNTCMAFGFSAELAIHQKDDKLELIWTNQGNRAALKVDFATYDFDIEL